MPNWFPSPWFGPAPILVTPAPPPAIGALGSPVAICSAAFLHLGLAPISDLGEAAPRARAASQLFQATVDEVIYDAKWSCSLVRTSLSERLPSPAWDYAHAFALPTDPYCLRVWATSLDRTVGGDLASVDVDDAPAARGRWAVEGRLLVTDAAAIHILYGARLTDPNQFDPGLTSALVLKLASKLAYPLTGKAPLATDLRKLYEIELARAKGSDSQQHSPRTAPSRYLGATR
jgi:hypothetical protein